MPRIARLSMKPLTGRTHQLRAHAEAIRPRGGVIDVTPPLPEHMKINWELFGFDVKQYDPIEEAPEE